MLSQKVCLLLYFLQASFFHHQKAKCYPDSDASILYRAMPFGDVRNGKRLTDTKLGSFSVITSTKCAMLCLKEPMCKSFNFCSRGIICELNEHDVFSTVFGEQLLQDAKNCFYIGMRRDQVPVCFYGWENVKISNDESSDFCGVNSKRIDTQWTSWEYVIEDAITDWKEIFQRDVLLEAAHGGISLEGNEKMSFWLKWVREAKTWDDAQRNCGELGGTLFSKLNGTVNQLNFFTEKMGYQPHWLGFYTEDRITWKTVEGQEIANSLLIWQLGQPNNWKGVQFHGMNGLKGTWLLNDESKNDSFFSICDMMKY